MIQSIRNEVLHLKPLFPLQRTLALFFCEGTSFKEHQLFLSIKNEGTSFKAFSLLFPTQARSTKSMATSKDFLIYLYLIPP
jgi:hypothetical protein